MSQIFVVPNNALINGNISRFFKVVISLQLSLWGIIALDIMSLQIPIIRQLIGLIYLIILPGTLILRILKLNNLDIIETILYTVGLSISILMFTGFCMNILYPILGIHNPISLFPLVSTISMITLILCILLYITHDNSPSSKFIDIKSIFSSSSLLYLIPFLSIIGTYLVNFYQSHIVLYILLIILSLMPVSTIIFNIPSESLYPTTIFIIAISLLYHWSLIGMHLSGGDIHYEYYYSNLVYLNNYWNSDIGNSINAMLSIVMLAPIISIICDMSLVWVFKIVFPLFYALVPLGLYQVFQKQIDKKSAFLSAFFFMAVFPFFSEMLQLARQQIAELFLVLLILLISDKNMNSSKRAILSILFAISLAVSHYGLSYFYLFLLIVSIVVLFLKGDYSKEKINVTHTFLLVYLVFILAWYIYLSSSSAVITLINVIEHIIQNLASSLLNSETSQGLAMIINGYSPLHEVTKYFYLVSQLFIFIGVIGLMFIPNEHKFGREYGTFSIVSLIICLSGIVIPNFASALNTTRLFHITLFFLAPFSVTGVQLFFNILYKTKPTYNILAKKMFSIYLMFFLLLTSGFFYELAGDMPVSIALNDTFDATRYNDMEVYNAKWVSNSLNESKIYADPYGKYLLEEFLPTNKVELFAEGEMNGFLYLREINLKTGTIPCIKREKSVSRINYQSLDKSTFYVDANKVYSNGGSDLLLN